MPIQPFTGGMEKSPRAKMGKFYARSAEKGGAGKKKRRLRGSKRREIRTRSAASRHADDLRIASTTIPERQQNKFGVTQSQLGRTRRAVVENVLVEQFMKAINRDAEHAGGFAFGVVVSLSSVQVNHHIRPRGQLALYLFQHLWNIG